MGTGLSIIKRNPHIAIAAVKRTVGAKKAAFIIQEYLFFAVGKNKITLRNFLFEDKTYLVGYDLKTFRGLFCAEGNGRQIPEPYGLSMTC